MTPEEDKKFTEGLFQQMQITSDYLREGIFDMIKGILNKKSKEDTFFGLFCRVICLMKTLRKCNDNTDFQTISHANRALLELATDHILLHHDKSDGYLRMRAWEESAKLKAAERIIQYYAEKGEALPEHFDAQMKFIATDKTTIMSQRQQFWCQDTHPNTRWTNCMLDKDVEHADSLEGTNLKTIYCTEYQRMNWMTHGSGLTGLRYMEPSGFMNLCGLSYAACNDLALLCAKMTLKEFGYWKSGVYIDRWEEINERIQRHIAPFLPR